MKTSESPKNRFFDRKMLAAIAALIFLSVTMKAMNPPDILDARFFYTGGEARALFASLNEAEAANYFRHEIADLLFIFTYTSVLFMALRKRVPRAAWLAFPPGLFDLVETAAVLSALKSVPLLLDQLGYVTAAKWIFFSAAKLTVVYGLLKARVFARRP